MGSDPITRPGTYFRRAAPRRPTRRTATPPRCERRGTECASDGRAADEHRRHVDDAACRASCRATTATSDSKLRGEHHGRDLRLVADLGEEEGDDRHAEHAPARRRAAARRSSSLSGFSAHAATAKNDRREQPAQDVRGQRAAHPVADPARDRVVDERGDEDAGDDRPRPRIARGEDEGEELRLVAEFAERDDGGGDEEGFEHLEGSRPARFMLLS